MPIPTQNETERKWTATTMKAWPVGTSQTSTQTPIPSRSKKSKSEAGRNDFYNLCTSLTLLSLPTTNLSCLPLASSAPRNTPSLNGSV